MSISTPGLDGALAEAVAAVRAATTAPIVLGGGAVPDARADDLDVDHITTSATDALEAFEACAEQRER